MKNLQNIISICILIGMIVGALNYFATATELNLTQQRVDYWISYDQFKSTREQIKYLEKECALGCSVEKKLELEQLKEDKEMLKKKMEFLEKK